MSELTSRQSWNHNYESRVGFDEVSFGWRNRANSLIAEKIEQLNFVGKSVLEVGAGDSQWLPYFAKRFASSRFAGLDYAPAGCERLARRVASVGFGMEISIYEQDMFTELSDLHGKFDVVMSFGVVEHFSDLERPVTAKRKFLRKGGLMFTLIPNMAGSVGYLTRLFNRAVYEMHNPVDLQPFVDAHRRAGMSILSAGYLGSTNYGVLSNCFVGHHGFSWQSYVFLTRLSKAIGWMEMRVGDFPPSKLFSPYIYAISQRV